MTVRIKELVIRYEDDGQESPLSAEEHKRKYRPLSLEVHHHCAPPPLDGAPADQVSDSAPQEYTIDLSKIAPNRS